MTVLTALLLPFRVNYLQSCTKTKHGLNEPSSGEGRNGLNFYILALLCKVNLEGHGSFASMMVMDYI